MRNYRVLVCLLLATAPVQLFGTDLSLLDKGRNVQLVMVGQGPICEGKVVTPSPAAVALKLSKTTPDCGAKDQIIYLSEANVTQLIRKQRLTQGRVLAKVLLGCAGMAALAAVPLASSDPEGVLILANYVVPATVLYSAWKAVPRRMDYLVIMTCSDRQHCVSTSDPRLKMPGRAAAETRWR